MIKYANNRFLLEFQGAYGRQIRIFIPENNDDVSTITVHKNETISGVQKPYNIIMYILSTVCSGL